MTEKLIDPDCRDGKCGSCVGGPCECHCHEIAALKLRAELAEARILALQQFHEKSWDQHMRFGVIGMEDVELTCADWCYLCKLEAARADAEDWRKRAADAGKLITRLQREQADLEAELRASNSHHNHHGRN